jgi:uncharacterized protein
MKLLFLMSIFTLTVGNSYANQDNKPKVSHPLSLTCDGNYNKFVPSTLKVKAGSTFQLFFKNSAGPKTFIEHNWVVVKPGSEKEILAAARTAGSAIGWIPQSPNILLKAFPLSPGNSVTLTFTAPAEPGDYPFLSTVPHQEDMRGILKVIK